MLTIRPARADDYAAYVRLFAELGVPDPVPSAPRFAEALVPQMHVACESDEVVAYGSWRPYGAIAHVIQIAVDPQHRGRRIGEQMLRHIAGEARTAGCTRWYLNVKRDNQSAIKLYERVGFRFELESVVMKIAWRCVPDLAVHGGLAEPSEDAEIAARFGVVLERIATFRARAGYRLVVVRDGTGIVAFAAFDPGFPGAATFCAAQPELAASLLAAMRAYADPQFDFTRVSVEGDRALADAVIALGAEVTFEVLRLSADL
jgi:GNAT superfamily N-acetyltransferase